MFLFVDQTKVKCEFFHTDELKKNEKGTKKRRKKEEMSYKWNQNINQQFFFFLFLWTLQEFFFLLLHSPQIALVFGSFDMKSDSGKEEKLLFVGVDDDGCYCAHLEFLEAFLTFLFLLGFFFVIIWILAFLFVWRTLKIFHVGINSGFCENYTWQEKFFFSKNDNFS